MDRKGTLRRSLPFIIGEMIVTIDCLSTDIADEETTRWTGHFVTSFDLVEALEEAKWRERRDWSRSYLSAPRTFPDHRFCHVFLDEFAHLEFHAFLHFLASQRNMVRFFAQSKEPSEDQRRRRSSKGLTGKSPSYIRDWDNERLYHLDYRQWRRMDNRDNIRVRRFPLERRDEEFEAMDE